MQDINVIKEAIFELYKNKISIHVDVHSTRPKINITNAEAHITGVYKNLFTLETIDKGLKKIFSVQYTDIFIGKVNISEIKK